MTSIYSITRQVLRGVLASNLFKLLRFSALLIAMVLVYSAVFRHLMLQEGHEYSWPTSIYWTLTVMTTLGFGDITFAGDVGRTFTVLVLVTGIVGILVVLPLIFLEFVYEPWMQSQSKARVHTVPRMQNHIVLTRSDPICMAITERLGRFDQQFVFVINDFNEALRLDELGYDVVAGDLDDPDTYLRVHVADAALVVATQNDALNASIITTVQGIAPDVPVFATADHPDAAHILRLAGSSQVIEPVKMVGEAMGRRTRGEDSSLQLIGEMGDVRIAEVNANITPLVGRSLSENHAHLNDVNVIGLWNRGSFDIANPDSVVEKDSVVVLAGSRDQLDVFDGSCNKSSLPTGHVIIIGGGRVGCAAAEVLDSRGIPYKIIEQDPDVFDNSDRFVQGSALHIEKLIEAGISDAPSVLITTHNDESNIFLTISCRNLRPDIQIISRSTMERNIATLHRSGSDVVLSDESLGASTVINLFKRNDILMVAEGLDVFRIETPKSLVGRTIADASIRRSTGCNIVSISMGGDTFVNPAPDTFLQSETDLVLIGTPENERNFRKMYQAADEPVL